MTTDTADQIQPNRYVEDENFIPDPTAQFGVALTRGNINPTDSLETITPMWREQRGGADLTDDEYFLTAAQRDAALTDEDLEARDEARREEASQAAEDDRQAAADRGEEPVVQQEQVGSRQQESTSPSGTAEPTPAT